MTLFQIRLQGGPFDGERLSAEHFEELPAAIWVERCKSCGIHALPERTPKGEKYRRDDEQDGEHIYVYCDERLARLLTNKEEERVPALT